MGSLAHAAKALVKKTVGRNPQLYQFTYLAKEKIEQAVRRSRLVAIAYKLTHSSQEAFSCPICHYHGPFSVDSKKTRPRLHAKCPSCGALERHRLQFLVMQSLAEKNVFSKMDFIHFAPERFLQDYFKQWFGSYTTADLLKHGVDYNVDLTDLPFSDEAYDCVFASHVLEHIKEDGKALSEIRRILKPGGLAILPVPMVADLTVEYPGPNPYEHGHVRAPGRDYFQRYRKYFDSVEEYGSNDFSSDYQLYKYEDRSAWPTETMPLRPTMQGDKHLDIVPVCHVKA